MNDPRETSARTPAEEGFESQLEAIRIKVESFEGPLDLLVHLIRKNRMSVRDIPIHLITEQYLAHLDLMHELNLDVAGEFLVMAATLIHIKSRMLLPRPDPTQDDPDSLEDPRDALVRRLLEHQKFKAAAELLHDRETLRSAQWMRPDKAVEAVAGDDYEPELEVDLFSLLSAFRSVLERARERPPVTLPAEQIPIEVRIEQLLERLSETDACGFADLFDDAATRGDMIVTFLALLEMIRLKLIRVFQSAQMGAIRIYKRARPQDAPHPIHDPEDQYKEHHRAATPQVPLPLDAAPAESLSSVPAPAAADGASEPDAEDEDGLDDEDGDDDEDDVDGEDDADDDDDGDDDDEEEDSDDEDSDDEDDLDDDEEDDLDDDADDEPGAEPVDESGDESAGGAADDSSAEVVDADSDDADSDDADSDDEDSDDEDDVDDDDDDVDEDADEDDLDEDEDDEGDEDEDEEPEGSR